MLIGVSGAVQGQAHRLEAGEIGVGRSSSCAICVPHRSVSREHCILRVHDDRIEVHDRGSHNGTFVNGLPVRERVLADGDELLIGAVSFVFRSTANEAGIGLALRSNETSMINTAVEENAPLAREAATLARVAEIARLVQQLYPQREAPARREEAMRLFIAIFEIIPSRRGLLLLLERSDEPTVLAEFAPAGASVAVPHNALDRVTASRRAVCGTENGAVWVASPLLVSGRLTGMLYLDSEGERRDYGPRDAQTIAAIADVLALAIENARDLQTLNVENVRLRAEMAPEMAMIGESAAMSALQNAILKVSRSATTVLIHGESGVGKELVARAIHRNSPRHARPFVAVNCAAISESLLESEFFGHEKGAFTGAIAQRKGRFETADGGTVFLDEIGELGPPLQAKLLRVLQEHEFERVGGSRPVKVDVRVIAATNRDLEKAIREGTFREDLFYRLNVVPLRIPPLRQRRDDIAPLAAYFVRKYSEEVGRPVTGISREARALLVAYDWPGNVRELQNAMERAVVMGSAEAIVPEDLPDVVLDTAAPEADGQGFHDAVRQHRRRLILAALERANGNVAEAARALKLHPVYLHRLITSLGLRDQLP